jgi:transposase InsO family protein
LRYNIKKESYHPAKSITANKLWDYIEIDLIGPLPTSEKGHRYILIIVDVCTNYIVTRALENKEMEVMARKLWKIFCEYSTPRILQSDNGTEFVNQVIKVLTIMYEIDHRLTTAYHPSANGLVERKNKEISRALKKFCEGTYTAWNNWLLLVQLSLNEGIS